MFAKSSEFVLFWNMACRKKLHVAKLIHKKIQTEKYCKHGITGYISIYTHLCQNSNKIKWYQLFQNAMLCYLHLLIFIIIIIIISLTTLIYVNEHQTRLCWRHILQLKIVFTSTIIYYSPFSLPMWATGQLLAKLPVIPPGDYGPTILS